MSRATLGHNGRQLGASVATHIVYAAAVVAALARFCVVLEADRRVPLLALAGAWATAFLGFAAAYGPALWGRRH